MVFIIISTLGIVGCKSEKEITLNKEVLTQREEIRDRLNGNSMGIYSISNLEKGEYKVSITYEEYNKGKLKKSEGIIITEIEIMENNEIVTIGINKNNSDKMIFDISQHNKDRFISSATSAWVDLDNIDIKENGFSWNMLDGSSEYNYIIKLDEEIAIACLNVGDGYATYGMNLGNSFVKPNVNDDILDNKRDIIFYLKISKI